MHAYILKEGYRNKKICNGIPLALHMPLLTNQHIHTWIPGLEMIQQQPKQEDDLPIAVAN